jgi:arabinogalactan oligomer/maltooligosaccharide transport system substrate-binding protein
MYYDKSVYTEEDIKSLDAMMAKKPVGFEVTNTWYLPAFYFAAGGTMFGADGIDGAAGITFGGENGTAATLYVANALAAGTMIEGGGGAGLDAMRSGKIGAMFSGTWDAGNYKEALGENYAAAQLPCITLNGQECQLRSFAGSKAFAANPNSANPEVAIALAAWLGSAEMQDLHYQIRNGEVIPCSVSLIASGNYDSDPAAVAQNNTIANTSFLQPSIPEMGTYWGNADPMGKALVNGEINADNAAEMTETWNAGLNGGGL